MPAVCLAVCDSSYRLSSLDPQWVGGEDQPPAEQPVGFLGLDPQLCRPPRRYQRKSATFRRTSFPDHSDRARPPANLFRSALLKGFGAHCAWFFPLVCGEKGAGGLWCEGVGMTKLGG